MYSPLNEDYMFQEMKDRTDAHACGASAGGHRRTRRTPLVAQGVAPCGMMTDVRMDRSRTESIVGRERRARGPAPRRHRRRRDPDGAPLRGRGCRQDPAADRGAGPPRRREGWRALVGHCLDFGETSMPYLPFAEMLGQVGEVAPEVVEPRSPPGARPGCATGRPADEPSEGLDRAEVFEAMYALVEDLAALGPVVLVVEDAHWADASTRDLISFLLSRRLQGRCLLVVTFRSDEMHRRHPLRKRVAEWVRLPGVERIQLDPLPAGAVRGMVEQMIGSRARPSASATTTTSSASCSARRATRSTSRSWSAPSWAAAGAFPRTWPTSCSSGSTASTSPRATSSGWPPRPASGSRTTCWPGSPRSTEDELEVALRDGDRRQRARAHRRLGVRLPARPARRGGVRRPAARRADAPAHGVRRGGARAPRQPRQPPTWPGTRSPRTTCPPPCRPASRRATRRWPPVAPTRRPGTSPRRWRSTTRAAAPARRPAGRGRAGGPHRRRAVQRRPPRDCARR